MFKPLLAATLGAGLAAASAQAQVVQEGRSTYVHHHRHAAPHHAMTYGSPPHHGVSYGVGSPDPKTTATGGNPGGYSNRN